MNSQSHCVIETRQRAVQLTILFDNSRQLFNCKFLRLNLKELSKKCCSENILNWSVHFWLLNCMQKCFVQFFLYIILKMKRIPNNQINFYIFFLIQTYTVAHQNSFKLANNTDWLHLYLPRILVLGAIQNQLHVLFEHK